ncbi:hypothetical protein G3I33_28330, partial [Streptomyces sp. SID9124]|nr:hypothetical protein [Streptomyces sp. SID9124]
MTALPRGESPGTPATGDDTVATPDEPGPPAGAVGDGAPGDGGAPGGSGADGAGARD